MALERRCSIPVSKKQAVKIQNWTLPCYFGPTATTPTNITLLQCTAIYTYLHQQLSSAYLLTKYLCVLRNCQNPVTLTPNFPILIFQPLKEQTQSTHTYQVHSSTLFILKCFNYLKSSNCKHFSPIYLLTGTYQI
jgi:hypothetical protein